MMTEVQFLNRFQRQPNGEWACTKPIKINGPSGPLMIDEGTSFSPGALFMDSISRRNWIRWLRSIGCRLLDRLRLARALGISVTTKSRVSVRDTKRTCSIAVAMSANDPKRTLQCHL